MDDFNSFVEKVNRICYLVSKCDEKIKEIPDNLFMSEPIEEIRKYLDEIQYLADQIGIDVSYLREL